MGDKHYDSDEKNMNTEEQIVFVIIIYRPRMMLQLIDTLRTVLEVYKLYMGPRGALIKDSFKFCRPSDLFVKWNTSVASCLSSVDDSNMK